MGNAELLLVISDVKLMLVELKAEYASLKDEIRELISELGEQENNFLRYIGSVYRDTEKMPYCPACFDKDKKRVHLKSSPTDRNTTYFTCPVCKEWFEEA